MNDAGNFLIETCDETISRDLKQQLLLLNGRWRELFMQVKQVCGFAVVTSRYLLCHFHFHLLHKQDYRRTKVPNSSSLFKLERNP